MPVINDRTAGRNYPLPNASNLLQDDIDRLRTASTMVDVDITNILLAMALKADANHAHAVGDITGLAAALDGKVSAGQTYSLAGLSDVSGANAASNGMVLIRQGSGWTPVNLQITNISLLDAALLAKASIESPTFTGTPAAPTPAPGSTGTQIATAGFVAAALSALRDGVSSAYDTLSELALGKWDAGVVAGLTSKVTPVSNDTLPILDSGASNAGKKLTFANLRSWIAGFAIRFDTSQTLTQAQKGQFAINAGQGWEQIGPIIDLAGLATQVWTGLSAYRYLELEVDGVPANSGVYPVVQTSSTDGASWDSGASQYSCISQFKPYGFAQSENSQVTTGIALTFSNWGNSAGAGGGWSTLNIAGFNAAGYLAKFSARVSEAAQSGTGYVGQVSGYNTVAAAHDALRVQLNAGVWTSGKAILRGVRG